MLYFSTNNPQVRVSLREAVIQGLAPDNGLYMPVSIPKLDERFVQRLDQYSFRQIALQVSKTLLGDDVSETVLDATVSHTIDFDAPLVQIDEATFALELFHGPTMAFKDFGARFMSQLLRHFAEEEKKEITVLVATSGDTGSAVANGFLGVEGTRVVVLYPSGKVSEIQEKQFTTLGRNITAVEVDGTFDDCQSLVKQSFLDAELKERLFLTSANSINIARLLPQSFYYVHAYARLKRLSRPIVFSVPSGNFGNLTAGLFAYFMGVPITHFVAATNVNDIVPAYLESGIFSPRASWSTISNAMDVGNPSNFPRMLRLFENDIEKMKKLVTGYGFSDDDTKRAMQEVLSSSRYLMDPHGAVGYLGWKKYRQAASSHDVGVFLETAHPAKFKETVESVTGASVNLPPQLQRFQDLNKRSLRLENSFSALKSILIKI